MFLSVRSLAAAAAALLALPTLSAAETVKIGAALSMTGPAAVYGATQKAGILAAVEELNKGCALKGITLEAVIEDDASTKEQGIAVFQRFINKDKVAAIIGPTLSNTATACSAGTNYFVLLPDGKVYRCLGGAAYRQQKPMGHISDFNPNMFEHPCEFGCVYSCDLDALRGKWDNAETHQATAIR